MDIQKEGELFEIWWENHGQYNRAGGGNYEKTFAWESWIAAKAQAVPEGFVLMPKEPTDEIIEAMNEFDYRNDYSDMDGAYRTIVETLEKAQEDAERGPAK